MPLPLAVAPLVVVVIAISLFFIIRWWLGRTGAALFFTLSLLLNLVIIVPVALGIMAVREVQDFQDTMSTTQKLLLVERGQDVLLAVSFTDVKDIEKGVSSFKPLSKEQVQRISGITGRARYSSLARDYYKVFVVEREFLERLASPSPTQQPSGQTGSPDNAALQSLLNSARDAFLAGDMAKLATSAAELQKAYGDRGMKEASDVARQVEQAAKAKDTKALAALGPKVMQLAATGVGGTVLPGQAGAGVSVLPVSSETIMKAIDSDDPAKVLLPYLPQQTVQEMSGGNAATLKLMLIAYLLASRFQNSLDPMFVISEYQRGDIQVYPETNVSTVLKLLPIDLLNDQLYSKPKL